jgi:hypothetical protein
VRHSSIPCPSIHTDQYRFPWDLVLASSWHAPWQNLLYERAETVLNPEVSTTPLFEEIVIFHFYFSDRDSQALKMPHEPGFEMSLKLSMPFGQVIKPIFRRSPSWYLYCAVPVITLNPTAALKNFTLSNYDKCGASASSPRIQPNRKVVMLTNVFIIKRTYPRLVVIDKPRFMLINLSISKWWIRIRQYDNLTVVIWRWGWPNLCLPFCSVRVSSSGTTVKWTPSNPDFGDSGEGKSTASSRPCVGSFKNLCLPW